MFLMQMTMGDFSRNIMQMSRKSNGKFMSWWHQHTFVMSISPNECEGSNFNSHFSRSPNQILSHRTDKIVSPVHFGDNLFIKTVQARIFYGHFSIKGGPWRYAIITTCILLARIPKKSANFVRVKKISQSQGNVHFRVHMQWFIGVH